MLEAEDYITELANQLADLPHRDDTALDALKRRIEMVVRKLFGDTSKYIADLDDIGFYPMVYPADERYYNTTWKSGVAKLENLLQTMSEEIKVFGLSNAGQDKPARIQGEPSSRSIFIVHGHAETVKMKVARFMERLGLDAVILHERPSAGATIIEKFERESSSVQFAIVLLTGDDVGSPKSGQEGMKPRARQNVIFELGYFIGALGRTQVAALVEPGVEIPSDYTGVIYIELDVHDAWQLNLARELKSGGIDVDLNRAI